MGHRIASRFGAVFFLVLAAGCAGTSHVPNPLLLPWYALTNAAENRSYDAKRQAVKDYLVQNELDLKPPSESSLDALMAFAETPESRREQLQSDLVRIQNLRGANWAEQATVIVMVMST